MGRKNPDSPQTHPSHCASHLPIEKGKASGAAGAKVGKRDATAGKALGASRKQTKRPGKRKKPMETSKRLAWWAIIVGSGSVTASYLLAWNGLESVETLSGTVFSACIGYLITYAGKSLGEKVSRNKYGLDADGNPLANGKTNDESEAVG